MIYITVAVLTGVLMGLFIPYNLSPSMVSYVSIALIAALDSVLGGFLAHLNKKFNMSVFMIGLISNAVLGILLSVIGNILGISLTLAIIIVFGVRMFNNLATLRRLTVDKYFMKRTREKEREERLRIEAASEDSAEKTEETVKKAEENTEKTENTSAEEEK